MAHHDACRWGIGHVTASGDGAPCEEIGSFLVNDVMDCRTSTGPVTDCLARLKVTSLTKAKISK